MGREDRCAYDKVKALHQDISEEMLLLKKMLPYLNNQEAYDNVKKVMDFVKEVLLKHFDWEEQEVFPVALAIGELDIKQIVRELQQQHIFAISKFDIMSDLVVKYGFAFPNDDLKRKFVDAAREMLEITIQHARKEDVELFPFLMDKGVELDLKGQFQ